MNCEKQTPRAWFIKSCSLLALDANIFQKQCVQLQPEAVS